MKTQEMLRMTVGLAMLAALSPSQADEVPELAKTKECMTCHAVDQPLAKAPSFKEIAKKYRGVANADTMLAQKVKVGGVGHWGPSPMPGAGARVEISDEEAKSLVAWVLSLN
jgi:cytochrome c